MESRILERVRKLCLLFWMVSWGGWSQTAPEKPPRLTVRWEDPEQRDIFVVEGEKYECRLEPFPHGS